jgi:hypothetical protein
MGPNRVFVMWDNSPYIYDRYDDREIDDSPLQPSGFDHEARETVITDGVAMSYRCYQRRQGGG